MSENNERPRKTWTMLKRAYKGIALNSLPIGTLVKDVNSTFLDAPVVWKVADMNHEGYPKNSITLITERIVAVRPFDAAEPNSPSPIKYWGNSIYSLSNIRQWLNSDAEAGKWYTAQHSTDQAPTSKYVGNEDLNEYADDEGFLHYFSNEFKSALLNTTIIAINKNVAENVIDKIFLPSEEEVGFTSTQNNNIAEGTKLALFNSDASRKAYFTAEAIADSEYDMSKQVNKPYYWRLRTPYNEGNTCEVTTEGKLSSRMSAGSSIGVRPLCNLPSTVRVSEIPDENGVYTIVQFK